MTDKHDFKGALAALGNESHDTENIDGYVSSIYIEDVVSEKTLDAIEFALKLAERMQSGEVSDDVREIIANLMSACGCENPIRELEDKFYKAMTTQIKNDVW